MEAGAELWVHCCLSLTFFSALGRETEDLGMEDRDLSGDRQGSLPHDPAPNETKQIRRECDSGEERSLFLDTGEGQASTLSPALSPEASGSMAPWLAGSFSFPEPLGM